MAFKRKKSWSTKSALKSVKSFLGGKDKYAKTKSYSSFWWEDNWTDNKSKFSGLGGVEMRAGSDIVKLIKLANYQRAIANFVKIVTRKDIPVSFGGNTSFTNGKMVNISTDISDKNFDVSVGLALHEGSHIKLTNFEACKNYIDIMPLLSNDSYLQNQFKTLVNIIEDRRIDNYIFKSSPGYKAYYHKMYDHYFNSEVVTKGLMSDECRNPRSVDHYLFRICNFVNPATDLNALPRLREIYRMIDIPNIGRLQSTEEVCELAYKILTILVEEREKQSSDSGSGDGDGQADDGATTKANMTGGGGSEDADGDSEQGASAMPTLSNEEMEKLQKAYEKQKDFLNGNTKKKLGTKKLMDQLKQVTDLGVSVQVTGDKSVGMRQCLVYDFTDNVRSHRLLFLGKELQTICADSSVDQREANPRYKQILKEVEVLTGNQPYVSRWGSFDNSAFNLPDFIHVGGGYRGGSYSEAINSGRELGALLGRKLVLRNEERTLVHNRLVSGHMDAKRIAHAGYGVENIFKQIHIDKYKKSNLHISLDMSGSMSGSRWAETIKMTTAICKAATYVNNLDVQVSVRSTQKSGRRDLAMIAVIYDSRKNTFKQYIDWISSLCPTNTTPEGVCFDALLKQNLIVPTASTVDSYFLNISDGEPGMDGMSSQQGVVITRNAVRKMIGKNISVLSFFVNDSTNNDYSMGLFKNMYGKDARQVNSNSVVDIARELNRKFLTEGIVHA